MSTSAIMFILGLSYFLAHLFQFLFSRFKIPDVLLFMLIGLTLGPGTGFVDQSDFGRTGEALSTLALVLILFDSGVTLNIRAFKKSWAQTLSLTLLTLFVTGAVFFGLGLALGLSSSLSLILGAVLSGTSSAVVIPMIQSLGLKETTGTIATIESALTDVLCIVITASLIDAHLSGEFSFTAIAGSITISLFGAAILGLLLGLGWLYFSQFIQKVPNTAFAMLAFGLVVYGLAEAASVSGGITIMAYGFALANGSWILKRDLEISEIEKTVYSELIFILKTFFFIYLGTSLVFKDLSIVLISFAGTVLTFILRLFITKFAAPKSLPLRDRSYLVLLIPKGLAAAVLASIPTQRGIPGGDQVQLIVYSVVFFSILLCALFIPFIERPRASQLLSRILGSEQENHVSERLK